MVQFLYTHRAALWPGIDFSSTVDGEPGTGFTMSAIPQRNGSNVDSDEDGDADPEYAAERAALQNQMDTLSASIDGITSAAAETPKEENPYDMVSDSSTPYGEQEPAGGESGGADAKGAAPVAPPPPRAAVRTF